MLGHLHGNDAPHEPDGEAHEQSWGMEIQIGLAMPLPVESQKALSSGRQSHFDVRTARHLEGLQDGTHYHSLVLQLHSRLSAARGLAAHHVGVAHPGPKHPDQRNPDHAAISMKHDERMPVEVHQGAEHDGQEKAAQAAGQTDDAGDDADVGIVVGDVL